MYNSAMDNARESIHRYQQELERIANRIQQKDPSLLLFNPVIDIELINNDSGFKIVRKLDEELGRNERNLWRPDLHPETSRDMDWSFLVAEIQMKLAGVGASYTKNTVSVMVTSKGLEALVKLWNEGTIFKSLVSRQKVEIVYKALKSAHERTLFAQEHLAKLDRLKQIFQLNINLYNMHYDKVWDKFDVIQRVMKINDSALFEEIVSFEEQHKNFKQSLLGKNIDQFSEDRLSAVNNIFSDFIQKADHLNTKIDTFVDKTKEGLFKNMMLQAQAFDRLQQKFNPVSETLLSQNRDLYMAVQHCLKVAENLPTSLKVNQLALTDLVGWAERFYKNGSEAQMLAQEIDNFLRGSTLAVSVVSDPPTTLSSLTP